MKMAYLVSTGEDYTDGGPSKIFRRKKDAQAYCRADGFRGSDDVFHGRYNDIGWWRNIEPIEFFPEKYDGTPRKLITAIEAQSRSET